MNVVAFMMALKIVCTPYLRILRFVGNWVSSNNVSFVPSSFTTDHLFQHFTLAHTYTHRRRGDSSQLSPPAYLGGKFRYRDKSDSLFGSAVNASPRDPLP